MGKKKAVVRAARRAEKEAAAKTIAALVVEVAAQKTRIAALEDRARATNNLTTAHA